MKSVYIAALAFVSLLGCQKAEQTQPEKEPESTCLITPELKELISFQSINEKQLNQEIELTGSVNYDQDHLFSYQSLVSGVVQKVNFRIGDHVRKGQVLFEVRTTEISTQKSELLKARADLTLAQRRLGAVENLYKDGVASEKEVQEAKSLVAAAEAEVERINETALLQGGNLETGIVQVRSPLDGDVVEKNITQGTQIDVGQDNLFAVSDLRKVWVMANVYAAQLEQVNVGQTVQIQTTAYPEKAFVGKISRLSNTFDPEERVLKAVIEIENQQLLLKPSMMVSVNLNYRSGNQLATAIPKDVVLFADERYSVIKYNSDCDVRVVEFVPIGADREFYYTRNDDIRAHDAVVAKNQLLIYNKLKEL